MEQVDVQNLIFWHWRLQKKNNWENIIILEDDFIFNRKINIYKFYDSMFNMIINKENKDVVLLGYHLIRSFSDSISVINSVNKLNSISIEKLKENTWLTHSYFVQKHYYDTLISNYSEALAINCPVDCHWHKLQNKDNWFIVTPQIGVQNGGSSNIARVPRGRERKININFY